jgi:hypothetical protein
MAKIAFYRVSGSKKKDKLIEVDDKYIGLQNRREGALIIKFRGPEDDLMEIHDFFEALDDAESVPVDIDSTGPVEYYFRGISPLSDETDEGLPIKAFDVTLQLRRELL